MVIDLFIFASWFNLGRLYIYWICPFYCHIIVHSNLLIILCISVVSVVISPFFNYDYFLFGPLVSLMNLAKGLSILFIFSKN